MKVQVFIVGGGPVGLTLAIDLGRRGIRCALVERQAAPLFVPKMELCNARTMEIFRRLGIAGEVRRRGYDADLPMDVVITRSLQHEPILRLAYPSANAVAATISQARDGGTAREPYCRISQYTLEPLLREVAAGTAGVTTHFGAAFTEYRETADGLVARFEDADGAAQEVACDWLVGCDGAGSTVRRQLGVALESFVEAPPVAHLFFRSEALPKAHRLGVARHYNIASPAAAALVTQDRLDHYGLHAPAAAVAGASPEEIIADVVGRPVPVQLHHVGEWRPRLAVAARYGAGRVVLAGDAAHQFIPTGGFGLNTGIVDATNLAWKLAAVLQGWGGPGLIGSYLVEQRALGLRNCAASREAAGGAQLWRAQWTAQALADTAEGEAARGRIRDAAEVGQRKSHEMNGVELGYSHAGSPVIADEPGDAPDAEARSYRPSTWPGAHVPHLWPHLYLWPHLWRSPGQALYDELGDGFALIASEDEPPEAPGLDAAFRGFGAPLKTLAVGRSARAVLERRYVLVRPDLHVVWRGDVLPERPAAVAALGCGWRSGAAPA